MSTRQEGLTMTLTEDLEAAHRTIHLAHLEQLKRLPLREPPVEAEFAASALDLKAELQAWTQESQGSVARVTRFSGRGATPAEVDWDVAMVSMLAAFATALRDYKPATAAQSAVVGLFDGEDLKDDIEHALKLLMNSQQVIQDIASLWGMKFTVLCDLVDYKPDNPGLACSGPYCGVFLFPLPAVKMPFIILAFKGTTTTNERITDLDYEPVNATNGILFNAPISRGIYRSLFGTFSNTPYSDPVPFDLILDALQVLTAPLKPVAGGQIPVYVTGHSLGASYATLFYAEALRRVGTGGGATFVLCDLHTFGCPRLGHNMFAKSLAPLVTGLGRHTWRIANADDYVPSVPPLMNYSSKTPVNDKFVHTDTGRLISKSAKPSPIATEIDKGPAVVDKGTWANHDPPAYYAAMKFAVAGVTRGV